MKGDRDFCYYILKKVSRSFAIVILELPEELRDAVCGFYLALRALDSIEDNTVFPPDQKKQLLRNFYYHAQDVSWRIENIGDVPAYRMLLEEYPKVARFLRSFSGKNQKIILDVVKAMGEGMADFVSRPIVTLKDYDLYCHHVAGLVGHGLSNLFSNELAEKNKLSNSMGLFLQKTNIIRDVFDDFNSGRVFWPEEIWRKYTSSFREVLSSVDCLNEMVQDALRHIPDCLEYMSMLKQKEVFRFCAIPQVMAYRTLLEVYRNPKVFTQNVKIPKNQTIRYFSSIRTMDDIYREYQEIQQAFKKK